ncbi:MAG: hypothetical protein JSV16_14495 [Candidatus Hydrogenedentota bacterium]|nr:MAG: hypothetical protein JSV16_14495 [Candidatus Hydrogenedentota bacterium]
MATTGLTDRHIQYLESLTHLKSLTFWGSADKLTDASLASIAKLKVLEELYFIMTSPKFTGGGFAHLKRLKHLRKLDLGFVQISDARYLMELSQLEFVKPIVLTADNMKVLSGFHHFKALGVTLPSLPNGSINDPLAALQLGALGSLEELNFCGSAGGRYVSDEEMACLESLGRLKKLHVGSNHLTDRGIVSISKLGQLEHLDISGHMELSKRGLNRLRGLTNLQTLDVKVFADAIRPSDGTTLDVSALTNVKTLELSGCSLQDADLVSLAGLRHLEWLILDGTFSEEGLWRLSNLSELKHLTVNGISCTVGDRLGDLGGLAKLGHLTLRGRITDAALGRLTGLSSLWSLRVETDELIRPETVAHLKQAMPAITYIHIDKPQVRQPSRRQQHSLVNPPRVNPRTSQDRRRRR